MSKLKFYRYIEGSDSNGGIKLYLEKYKSIKETPCGHWIICTSDYDPFDTHWNPEPPRKWWVSNTSRKRRAYPDKELALESFIYRKRSQIRILKEQLERANKAFDAGVKLWDETILRKKHKAIIEKHKTVDGDFHAII